MGVMFDSELKKLKSRFVEMGLDTNEQLYQATKAFLDHDSVLAKKVINGDLAINDEEVSLEKRALKLIALQQPLANDFRTIISILKASNDVERLGDYAVHIGRATVQLKGNHHSPESEQAIEEMSAVVREMLEKVLDAYVYTDEKAAYEVANQDLKVDIIYVREQKRLLEKMMSNGESIPSYEQYVSVIRTLERAGDHIVNLAEWVIYIASGKLVELNPGKTDPDLVEKGLKDTSKANKK